MEAILEENISWHGHRMTGANGARTIKSLTQLLDLKELNKVNSLLDSSYYYYSPWMCSYGQSDFSELQELNSPKGIGAQSKEDLKRIYPSCTGQMFSSKSSIV